jgi:hypothetical protein
LRDRADNTMGDHQLLIALWTLPVTMMFAALVFVPLGPIVLLWFAWRLLQRLAQSESAAGRTAAASGITAAAA